MSKDTATVKADAPVGQEEAVLVAAAVAPVLAATKFSQMKTHSKIGVSFLIDV